MSLEKQTISPVLVLASACVIIASNAARLYSYNDICINIYQEVSIKLFFCFVK